MNILSALRHNVAVTAVVLAIGLGGCAGVTDFLTQANKDVSTYAPIVGQDLLMIGNIIVEAECSPALAPTSQVAVNILNIVAPNSSAATSVDNFLSANAKIASQLCPLVAAIKTQIGTVPAGAPTQVVATSTAQAVALKRPVPVVAMKRVK